MNKLFIIIAMIILYLSINKNKYILILRDKKIFYKKYYIFRFNYYRNNHFYPTINKNNNINAIQIHLSFYNKDKLNNILKSVNYDNNTIVRALKTDTIFESKYKTTKLINKYKNISKFYPKTILHDDKNMLLKLNDFNYDNYVFLKNDQDSKKGVIVVNSKKEVVKGFKSGKYLLVQEPVPNSLKIKGFNFVIRYYGIIHICKKNKKTLFTSKYGVVNYPLKKDSKDPNQNLITYTSKSKNVIDLGKNKPKETNSLSKYLKKDLNKILHNTTVAFCKEVKSNFKKLSNFKKNICYNIYGFDYMFDKDLNPYILEINLYPSTKPNKDPIVRKKFYGNMLKTEIKILNNDLKSIKYNKVKL